MRIMDVHILNIASVRYYSRPFQNHLESWHYIFERFRFITTKYYKIKYWSNIDRDFLKSLNIWQLASSSYDICKIIQVLFQNFLNDR